MAHPAVYNHISTAIFRKPVLNSLSIYCTLTNYYSSEYNQTPEKNTMKLTEMSQNVAINDNDFYHGVCTDPVKMKIEFRFF